jgi:hypothetical protein
MPKPIRLLCSLTFAVFTLHAARASAQRASPYTNGPSTAESPPEPARPHDAQLDARLPWAVLRGALGLGAGSSGFGGRAALSASVWPAELFGATVEYQAAADGVELFGAYDQFVLLSAGPSLRIPVQRFYAQTDLLFGGGTGDSYPGSSSLFDGPPKHPLSGLAFTFIEGVYWHPSIFELGPALEISLYDKATITTLDFTFGFAL